MSRETIRQKLLYFAWILFFVFVILWAGTVLYMKTSQVPLTGALRLTVEGPNGRGRILRIENLLEEDDESRNEYLLHTEYAAIPDSGLYNGQTITITAEPDLDLARTYQLYPVKSSIQIEIQGLPEDETQVVLEVRQ